jgi:hypothetical protein
MGVGGQGGYGEWVTSLTHCHTTRQVSKLGGNRDSSGMKLHVCMQHRQEVVDGCRIAPQCTLLNEILTARWCACWLYRCLTSATEPAVCHGPPWCACILKDQASHHAAKSVARPPDYYVTASMASSALSHVTHQDTPMTNC